MGKKEIKEIKKKLKEKKADGKWKDEASKKEAVIDCFYEIVE